MATTMQATSRGAAEEHGAVDATRRDSAAPSLGELQSLFQDAILRGDDTILGLIPDNSRTHAEVLFGVYRNAYVGRLVEVLRSDHPLTLRLLGDDAFDAVARDYIAAHPSRTCNARWVSRHFPDFCRTLPHLADKVHVADLVAIEAALNSAFDATDAPVLALAGLQRFAPETWDRLVFRPHPSARRLNPGSNAYEIWLAMAHESGSIPEPHGDEDKLLIWRQGTLPMLRKLGPEEAMMWDEAAAGVRFGVLCEMLAMYDDPAMSAVRAAQYLQGWLATELLTEASLGDHG